MKLKKLNPVTNGTRHKIKIQKSLLSKNNRLFRPILSEYKNTSGRSSLNGNITVWHKGGGVKKLYRSVDTLTEDTNSVVLATCYDPYRNSFINLNFELLRKKFFYNTATNSIYPGSLLKNSLNISELKLGFRTRIKNIPAGSIIHNLTTNNNSKAQYIKAAGTSGQILQYNSKTAKIKLPSKKIIQISTENFATIGIVSNTQSNLTTIGKAGTNRNLGVRPTVRGVAMNPVDHPHGGRANGGIPSVTPWGLPTKCGFYLRKKIKNK